jgi:glutathione S-transferase
MMDAQAKDAGDAVNIGTIAMAVACGYANFRYADLDWRTGRPNLAALYDQMMQRPSMKATQPDG